MLKKMLLLIGLLAGMFSVQAQTQNAIKSEETVVEVGNGTDLSSVLPFGSHATTSISLALYTPEDFKMQKGAISALAFEGKFTQEVTSAIQIYVGEVDLEKFLPWDAEFINPATLTKVFDGNKTFSEGDHQSVRFDFTESFDYSGEKTLAVYTFSQIEKSAVLEFRDNQFYVTETDVPMVINDEADRGEIDPMNPNGAGGFGASTEFERPNTKFFFASVSEEKYNLAFEVKDADGKAISDAVITLDGEKQEAGKYVFEDMSALLYEYKVEKDGFMATKGSVLLEKDTTLAITLTEMSLDHSGISGYLVEDFENIAQGKRPLNWTGDFYVDEKGGKDDSHRLTHSFWAFDGPRYITTNPIYMGSEPVFELEYRVMDYSSYPQNAFTGDNMTWNISVSEDFGETWEVLYNEDYGTHVASKDYKPFSMDVSAYAGKICQFEIEVVRQSAKEFYFDIDNIKIGTQLEKDLAIVSKIEGLRVPEAGTKNTYTVSVRNQGSDAVENYTLKFYDGETEIGSVAGTQLESGAFAKLSFEYTFVQEGEHTLTAQCVMEGDELTVNNITSEFYVSVQPEGIRGSMVNAYEGEDVTWSTPLNMYDKYSLSWIFYNQNDLAMEAGDNISGMAFRTKFDQTTSRMHLNVYIGETDSAHFGRGVPAPASLTKVFDGAATIEANDGGNFIINFDRAYRYTGKNLVVAVYKESSTEYSNDLDFFFYGYWSLGPVLAVSVSGEEPMDMADISLVNDDVMSHVAICKPSTIFLLNDNVSYYSVNFEVVDQDGKEVADATVTFDGTVMPAGQYKVENVPDGTYAYAVSHKGETVTGEVTVNGADVTEKVQFKSDVANENKVEENMASIYPNPTDGKLHINVAQGAKEINLYDISGRSVRKISRVPAGIIELDMTDCHSGIYLLKIDNQAFKVSKR